MKDRVNQIIEEARQQVREGKIFDGITTMELAAETAKSNGLIKEYARANNNLGIYNTYIGKTMDSLDCFLEGYYFSKKCGEYALCERAMNNIASIYSQFEDYMNVAKFLLKTLYVILTDLNKDEESWSEEVINTYINLAITYINLEEYDESEKYLNMSKQYSNNRDSAAEKALFLVINAGKGNKDYVTANYQDTLKAIQDEEISINEKWSYFYLCYLAGRTQNDKDITESVLNTISNYIKEFDALFYQQAIYEMWMEHFRLIGDMLSHSQTCIKYIEIQEQLDKEYHTESADLLTQKLAMRIKTEPFIALNYDRNHGSYAEYRELYSIGLEYAEYEAYVDAAKYLEEAVKTLKECWLEAGEDYADTLYLNYVKLAEVNFKKGDFALAKDWLKEAESLGKTKEMKASSRALFDCIRLNMEEPEVIRAEVSDLLKTVVALPNEITELLDHAVLIIVLMKKIGVREIEYKLLMAMDKAIKETGEETRKTEKYKDMKVKLSKLWISYYKRVTENQLLAEASVEYMENLEELKTSRFAERINTANEHVKSYESRYGAI